MRTKQKSTKRTNKSRNLGDGEQSHRSQAHGEEKRHEPRPVNNRGNVSEPEFNSGERVAVPVGAAQPETLQEMFARMLRQSREDETGEEYDPLEEEDFEPEDEEVLPVTAYEINAMDAEELLDFGLEEGLIEAPQESAPPTEEQPLQNEDPPAVGHQAEAHSGDASESQPSV